MAGPVVIDLEQVEEIENPDGPTVVPNPASPAKKVIKKPITKKTPVPQTADTPFSYAILALHDRAKVDRIGLCLKQLPEAEIQDRGKKLFCARVSNQDSLQVNGSHPDSHEADNTGSRRKVGGPCQLH